MSAEHRDRFWRQCDVAPSAFRLGRLHPQSPPASLRRIVLRGECRRLGRCSPIEAREVHHAVSLAEHRERRYGVQRVTRQPSRTVNLIGRQDFDLFLFDLWRLSYGCHVSRERPVFDRALERRAKDAVSVTYGPSGEPARQERGVPLFELLRLKLLQFDFTKVRDDLSLGKFAATLERSSATGSTRCRDRRERLADRHARGVRKRAVIG